MTDNQTVNQPTQPVFIASDGRTIPIKRISHVKIEAIRTSLEREYRQRDGEVMDPPTYTMELAGGGKQEMVHDAESIKDPKTSDEERAEYAAYQETQARFSLEHNRRLSELVLLRGVDLEPEDDSWIEEQRSDGIDVPEDARSRRIHWLWTEVLTDVLDVPKLVGQVITLSVEGIVPQQTLDAAEASFQRAVEDLKRSIVERVAGTET